MLYKSVKNGKCRISRAEVLAYNLCHGDKKELAAQFQEVRKLSCRTEKPALHLALRLAPAENLSRDQFAEIGQKCAEEFGVADHQYVCILHKILRRNIFIWSLTGCRKRKGFMRGRKSDPIPKDGYPTQQVAFLPPDF